MKAVGGNLLFINEKQILDEISNGHSSYEKSQGFKILLVVLQISPTCF